jgi:hypothetical protein
LRIYGKLDRTTVTRAFKFHEVFPFRLILSVHTKRGAVSRAPFFD